MDSTTTTVTGTYQLFPALPADERDELKASILERGVIVPIVVDEHGVIIDGHHRKEIADELGITYTVDVRAGLPEHEKRLLAFELNTHRRQLTTAQRVLLGERIEPDIAERARLRQLASLRNVGAAGSFRTDDRNEEQGDTRDEVAKKIGLGSGRTYARGKETIRQAEILIPDARRRIEEGTVNLKDLRHQTNEIVRRSDRHWAAFEHDRRADSAGDTRSTATEIVILDQQGLVARDIWKAIKELATAWTSLDRLVQEYGIATLRSYVTPPDDPLADDWARVLTSAWSIRSTADSVLGTDAAHG